jgi:hypothetical protein
MAGEQLTRILTARDALLQRCRRALVPEVVSLQIEQRLVGVIGVREAEAGGVKKPVAVGRHSLDNLKHRHHGDGRCRAGNARRRPEFTAPGAYP